jgi:transposase
MGSPCMPRSPNAMSSNTLTRKSRGNAGQHLGTSAFLWEVLVPQLRPGQVLIMDNLKAHKVAGVANTCAAAGVRLLSLPPYASDLSPIEACWSKVKALLRAKAARTLEALEEAIAEALAAITPTTSLESVAKICACKIAGLQAQATPVWALSRRRASFLVCLPWRDRTDQSRGTCAHRSRHPGATLDLLIGTSSALLAGTPCLTQDSPGVR